MDILPEENRAGIKIHNNSPFGHDAVSEGQSGFANAVIGIPAAISAVIIKLISKRLNLFIRFLPVSFPFPEILLYHERYKLDDPSIL